MTSQSPERNNVQTLELNLVAHEASCAERWKQVGETLTRLEGQITLLQERWWWLIISVAGAGISTTAAFLWAQIR